MQILVVYCSEPTWKAVGWQGVHAPVWPTQLRLFYTAGLRREHVVTRKESGTALFHTSLALTHGLTQFEIDMLPRPPLEAELEAFFIRIAAG